MNFFAIFARFCRFVDLGRGVAWPSKRQKVLTLPQVAPIICTTAYYSQVQGGAAALPGPSGHPGFPPSSPALKGHLSPLSRAILHPAPRSAPCGRGPASQPPGPSAQRRVAPGPPGPPLQTSRFHAPLGPLQPLKPLSPSAPPSRTSGRFPAPMHRGGSPRPFGTLQKLHPSLRQLSDGSGTGACMPVLPCPPAKQGPRAGRSMPHRGPGASGNRGMPLRRLTRRLVLRSNIEGGIPRVASDGYRIKGSVYPASRFLYLTTVFDALFCVSPRH